MDPLDRFEQGIENILREFDLRLSKPQSPPVFQNGIVGYYRDCDLRASSPTTLVLEKSWSGGHSDECVLDLSIQQDRDDAIRTYCHVNLNFKDLLVLDLNFFDFEKLRNYTPDPSLVHLMAKAKNTFEGEDSSTGKTRTFERLDDGSFKEISPLYLNSVRSMMFKDVLYEPIYKHDKKRFNDVGIDFLSDLAVYFYKSRKELGFSY